MVQRAEGRSNRRQNVIRNKHRGFAVYILLGVLVSGVVGLAFSWLLTAGAVKASLLVKDDVVRLRRIVCDNFSRPPIRLEKGDRYYSWEHMVWVSEVFPAAAMIFGRPSSTLGIEGDAYLAHRDTSKKMNSLFVRLLDNGVKYNGRALGKMFNVFWGDHGALIVPSVDDQFSIQFVSSQTFAFPEGATEARTFWSENAATLVSPSSPVSYMDIVW